jgi:nitroreductase/NAD-dependent dihydropyrimidine dehydrogenase PreA subunit
MSIVTVDAVLCSRCGICVENCPETVLIQRQGAVPEVRHPGFCIRCGQCAGICPKGAIKASDYPPGTVNPLDRKMIPTFEQTRELMRARRSVRAFQNKPVEREALEKILSAAILAPSAENAQSTQFVVVQDQAVMDKILHITAECIEKAVKRYDDPVQRAQWRAKSPDEFSGVERDMFDYKLVVRAYHEGVDLILHRAPALILFHADRSIECAEINCNLAHENATLAAVALGLGSYYGCFVTGACAFDSRVPPLLSLPENHQVYAAMVLGYPKFAFNNWLDRRPPVVAWV